MTNANAKLAHIRYLINGDLTNTGYGSLIDSFRELDTHLSAGGTPPEAWRPADDTAGYHLIGWTEETDLDNDDDRPGVYFLTIADPDGEEYAVIMHRVCGGKFPLDGEVAREKEQRADRIVAALNA